MEQRALQQSHQTFTGTGDEGNYDERGHKISGPSGTPLTLMERAAQRQSDRETQLGAAENRASNSPMPLTNASALYAVPALGARAAEQGIARGIVAPVARTVAGGIGGAAGGRYGGRAVGSIFGEPETGEKIGAGLGAVAGTYLGARGIPVPSRASLMERIFASQPATAATAEIGEGAAARTATGPLTRAPEPRPLFPGENPANMASVPREQLPSLAQQGKPGAVEQLQQLGERPVITPRGAGEYPGTRLQGTLSERLRSGGENVFGDKPPETEDFMERVRRRAPGENPAIKSIRRKMGGDTSRMAAEDEAIRKRAQKEK